MYVQSCVWTMFIIRFVTTKELCQENKANYNQIIINCSGMRLTDKNYSTIFKLTMEKHRKITAIITNRDLIIIFDSNELQTLELIPNYTQIVEISFKRNRIASIKTGTFQNLSRLKRLELSYNKLTSDSLTADTFKGADLATDFMLLSLEHLILGDNHIQFLQHDIFKYLPNLESLDLSNNPINIIDSDSEKAFQQINKLRVLNLAYTGLSLLPDIFHTNPIKMLFLNGNDFKAVPKSVKKNSLIYLNLNDNPIREIDSNSFTDLPQLRDLHISGMKNLTKIKENAFSPLNSLEMLQCSYNPILEFIDSNAFSELKDEWNLKELYINNNNLRYLFEETAYWNKLTVFNIQENPWNCTCSLQWLFTFVKSRQNHDPEANFGIKCKYPQHLNKQPLTSVGNFLKCPETKTRTIIISAHHIALKCIFYTTVIIALGFVLYYKVIKKIYTNRSRLRDSGTSIISTTKYKRAALNDTGNCDRKIVIM